MKIPLSIIIPCSDDTAIEDCINSVDEQVEIIVALNCPTREVENIVREHKNVTMTMTPKKGIANAQNIGIEKAKNNWVLLTDSDCVFAEGSIRALWKLHTKFRVIKGRVEYRTDSLSTKIVAKLKDFMALGEVSTISKPILFDKKIKKNIGYYFHPRLAWSEDADFNNRIKKNQIKIGFTKEGVIYHRPLVMKKDLRSAFLYGAGRQIGKEIGVYKPHTLKSFLGNFLSAFSKSIRIIIWERSVVTAIYYFFLWNISFRLGTISQRLFRTIKS